MDNYQLPSTNLNNLKVLFIDDKLDTDAKVYDIFLKAFFGDRNVKSFFDENAALAFFEENSKFIDIAFIDYSLNNNVNGDDFGRELTKMSPSIILIMLSADSQFSTCRNAMRNGFDDYILKKEYAGISEPKQARKKFFEAINPILSLPSVQAKLILKAESLNDKLKINRLTLEKNNLLIKTPPIPKRRNTNKKTPTIEKLLDYQEYVFEIGQELPDGLSINGDTLAFCMLYLEHNSNNKEVLNIQKLQEIIKYAIPEMSKKYDKKIKNPRATIQMRLKFYENNGITDVARNIYHLLEKNQTKWPLTRARANHKKLNPKSREMATFIDEIIIDYF